MLSFTAKLLKSESDVIVGRDAGNHFAIEITPDEPRSKAWDNDEVVVRVSIPYGTPKAIPVGTTPTGKEQTFLLTNEDARPRVEYRTPADSKDSQPISIIGHDPEPKPPPNSVCWELPDGIGVAQGQTMRIDVTGLAGNLPPGEATVTVGMRTFDDEEFSEKPVLVSIELAHGETGKPEIHYFDAAPDYVLHAGEDVVVLSFFTTGAKDVRLFKNNVEIWPLHTGSQDLFFNDTPSITSVYRLEAATAAAKTPEDRQQQIRDKTRVVRPLTVQVAQAGWNRQPLHQGYPTALFAAQEGDPLYGVFVNPATKPETVGLYSSKTGFPPWEKKAGGQDFKDIQDVNDGVTYSLSDMSHSPGVCYESRLYLIGGSSVDPRPERCSNEVWYYDLEKGSWVHQGPAPFSKRMGHACVVFNDKIWVLGGMRPEPSFQSDNEVWSFDIHGGWSTTPITAPWTKRCMFATVVTPKLEKTLGFEQPKLWVYGGKQNPNDISPRRDLWSSTNGTDWIPEDPIPFQPDPGEPNAATLFFHDQRLNLAGSFKRGEGDVKTLSAHIYSYCANEFIWEDNPVSWGWEQFNGNPFLMQSLVFNQFLFFWSLHKDIKTPPKLNVFIPS
jgi:hypothetical protein